MGARGAAWGMAVAAVFWAPAAAACSFEQAHYVLKSPDKVTADFLPHAPVEGMAGDLFLKVTVAGGGTYWYVPELGNGYSTVRLLSMQDPAAPGWRPPDSGSREGHPGEDQTYYGLNPDLSFRDEAPRKGAAAPQFILIPELAPAVWYDPDHDASRIRLPRAFFVLDHCRR